MRKYVGKNEVGIVIFWCLISGYFFGFNQYGIESDESLSVSPSVTFGDTAPTVEDTLGMDF